MNIKIFQEKDYPILHSWWTRHGWTPVAFEMLPKIGYIVNDVCAGFLYVSDSKLCHLEWLVSDPESEKTKRSDSLNILIDTLCLTAKEYGCKFVFTTSNNEVLIKRLQNRGFSVSDVGVTHLIKGV